MATIQSVTALLATGVLFVVTIASLGIALLGPIAGAAVENEDGTTTGVVAWVMVWLGIVAVGIGYAGPINTALQAVYHTVITTANLAAPFESVFYPVLLLGGGISLLVHRYLGGWEESTESDAA